MLRPRSHTLEVALPDGTAASVSDSFRVTGSYQRWLIELFENPEDRENSPLTGPGADPFGTGIANLLAYSVGANPQNPDRSRLPRPVLHTLEGSGGAGPATASSGEPHLAITYARDKGAADVIFIPEVSDDLITWHSGPAFTEEVEALDFGHYELVTARDLTPLKSKSRRFMRLKVRAGESLSSWQARHFPDDLFFDPAWSSSTASPAGDNISNLMKYALGLDPHTPSRAELPRASTAKIGDSRYLTFTYQRPKGRTDVDYIMEVSSDLVTWHSGFEYTETIFTIDRDPNELIIARDLRPLADEDRRFARLRVRRR